MKKLRELINEQTTQFWIGQVLTIFATIVGVYLAAQSGFEKAVDFELFKSTRDGYYLAKSFEGELKGNLERVEAEISRMERNGSYTLQKSKMKLIDDYVWMAMRYNEETLQVPTKILNTVATFYYVSNESLRHIAMRTRDWTSPKDHAKKVRENIDLVKKVALPALKSHIEESEKILKSAGVTDF